MYIYICVCVSNGYIRRVCVQQCMYVYVYIYTLYNYIYIYVLRANFVPGICKRLQTVPESSLLD